jgi:hypothetical protein
MQTSIEMLTEAAQATDELSRSVHTLADLMSDAASRGSEIVHWSVARVLRKKRRRIPDGGTDLWGLWIGTDAYPSITLDQFVAQPETADWMLFGLTVFVVADRVQVMLAELTRPIETFATGMQIKELASGLARRKSVLNGLQQLEQPSTDEEWAALKCFLRRYRELAQALRRFDDANDFYVERLRADGRWPIRGY